MKIAITGYNGRLGSEFIRQGCIPLPCDITDPQDIEHALNYVGHPDVVINCAAYTDVDKCENDLEYDVARQVNVWGVKNLLDKFDGKLVHISTDYIFNGTNGPYFEEDEFEEPVNAYGLTKLSAEAVIESYRSERDVTIIRTTGLYGRSVHHQDFVKLVRWNLSRNLEVKITNTLYGNQTYIPHLVEGIFACLGAKMPVINIASKEVISRYHFAQMIADTFELDPDLLIPVSSYEIPGWVAKRPEKGGLVVDPYYDFQDEPMFSVYSIQDGLDALKREE